MQLDKCIWTADGSLWKTVHRGCSILFNADSMVTKISSTKLWLDKDGTQAFYWKKKQDLQEYLEHVFTENYKCDEVGCSFLPECFTFKSELLSTELHGQLTSNKTWSSVILFFDTRAVVNLFYPKNCNQMKLWKKECHLMLSKSPSIVHLHPVRQSQKFSTNQWIWP